MSFSIVSLGSFDKELKHLSKKYPSLKKDYADLLDTIEANPKFGTPIGRNCYKIRLQIPVKAKEKAAVQG